ncbi:NAD(P)/FAD-dependent oxidoreductase [Cryobacterium melibiosiphilum]|uniref:NAD(P)/FAD-dependent oxidoreductase n=1 Tax=Cryobacterium melibiosiphilum TaxID=995039 RepID=A0A3A5MIW2_9MICO|nr:FAD/NAD(P)-binding oxidoreductase [Cryobacterium melibiosiphilum]RJT86181.1 NAD(P)/FAD-dependent oxidoreductase [Cryobacterium melibiosiphilum]
MTEDHALHEPAPAPQQPGQDQIFLIIGGGLAGARAAETLRAEGFPGRIIIVAAEKTVPYIRPPLSKGYLQGSDDRDSLDVHPAPWYATQGIEIVLGMPASALSLPHKTVTLGDGSVLHYDKLLFATGAAPRHFDEPSTHLTGVHHLRTADSSTLLRAALQAGGRRIVIIGSGWIGLEVAATARGYGNTVTVVGHSAVPLSAAIGEEAGAVFAELHRDHGVELLMNTTVHAIVGGEHGVTGVRLGDETLLPADIVVVAIGASPNVQLARAAGLPVHREIPHGPISGITVDAGFRTTDVDVYAVGDVASVFHPVLGAQLHVEHWANAENAGPAAARSMLGQHVAYDAIPYFYTDQFDLGMEYAGYPSLAADATVVFRGDRDGREFVAFWLLENRVVAGMNVNVWDVNETVQELIRSRVVVDPVRLTDLTVPLEQLLAGRGASERVTD